MKVYKTIVFLLCCLCLSLVADAATYTIGVGKQYATIGAFDTRVLKADDVVELYPGTYNHKLVVNVSGTPGHPIIFRGMGTSPDQVVIDGNNCSTPTWVEHTYAPLDTYALVYVGRLNKNAQGVVDPWTYQPSYLRFENFTVKNAHMSMKFTDPKGVLTQWSQSGTGIYLCKPAHVTIENVVAQDNGNCIFCLPGTKNIVIKGCTFKGNGNANSSKEHNTYLESDNVLYENNTYVNRRAGSAGTDLKDRSAGTIIRNNVFLDAASNDLDLVDAEEGVGLLGGVVDYKHVLVYGNKFVGRQPMSLVHFGGDTGAPNAVYRDYLWFYNNTFDFTADSTTAYSIIMFKLETPNQTVRAWNNTVTVKPATVGKQPSLLMIGYQYGTHLVTGIANSGFRNPGTPAPILGPYDNVQPFAVRVATGAGGPTTVVSPPTTPTPVPTTPPTTGPTVQELQKQIDDLNAKLVAYQKLVQLLKDWIAQNGG